jgi:DNA-binding transcriptional MerR regulator
VKPLTKIAQEDPSWSLSEFVGIVNAYLPSYLPLESSSTKVRDQVSARLIRHYTTQGMLDEPYKSGREARYSYRHLLQILVVRRLLADGYASHVIGDLATSKRNDELEALLQGGVQLQMTVANPALAYLHQIQERNSMVTGTKVERVVQRQSSPPTSESNQWTRLEVAPGFEVHIRDDFPDPNSSREKQNLYTRIQQVLENFFS